MLAIHKKIMAMESKEFFLFGASYSFGIWLLYLGLNKWIGGASGFVGYITKQFAETWAPEPLTLALAWIILIAEPLLGLWLITGKKLRLAWIATAKLMFMLMFGKTLLQDYPGVADNWQYLALALVCASFAPAEKE